MSLPTKSVFAPVPRRAALELSLALLIGTPYGHGVAADAGPPASFGFEVRRSGSEQFALVARGASLAAILAELERVSGVRIRQEGSSDRSVTLNCPAASLPHVIECLQGGSRNLLLESAGGRGSGAGRLVAIRILRADDARPAVAIGPGNAAPGEAPSEIDELLARTRSKQPEQRAQAVALLSDREDAGADEGVQAVLAAAARDRWPEVRAQALLGAVQRAPENATAILRDGLEDRDASVRLMAVDLLTAEGAGRELLEQALRDRDETVREYAALKLESGGAATNPRSAEAGTALLTENGRRR